MTNDDSNLPTADFLRHEKLVRCAGCRHWMKLDLAGNMRDQFARAGLLASEFGTCAMAENKYIDSDAVRPRVTLAWAEDGEGYSAMLVTHESFGCVQGEATVFQPPMGNAAYKPKIEALMLKHQLGFLYNPGGGEFTHSHPNLRRPCQVPANGNFKEDYEALMAHLIAAGLEKLPSLSP